MDILGKPTKHSVLNDSLRADIVYFNLRGTLKVLEYIRIVILALYFIFWGIISLVLCLIKPFRPWPIPMIAFLLSRFGFWLYGVKLINLSKERFNSTGPYIYLSNHQANFDSITWARICPKNTITIGKKSIKYIPFFGQIYWLSGNIMINRSHKRNAKNTMNEAAEIIKKQQHSVWVMPEGTRNCGKGLLPFKKGPFYTAIKAQVPIIPVAISSYHKFFDFNRLHKNFIMVKAYDPIETKNLTESDIPELLKNCRKIIEDGITDLDQQLTKLTSRPVDS